MLLILADKETQFSARTCVGERFSVFTQGGRASRAQLGSTQSLMDFCPAEIEKKGMIDLDIPKGMQATERTKVRAQNPLEDPEDAEKQSSLLEEMNSPTVKKLSTTAELTELIVRDGDYSDEGEEQVSIRNSRRRHMHSDVTRGQTDWEHHFGDPTALEEMGLAAGKSVAAFLLDDCPAVETKIDQTISKKVNGITCSNYVVKFCALPSTTSPIW
jgi:hypothetical protein